MAGEHYDDLYSRGGCVKSFHGDNGLFQYQAVTMLPVNTVATVEELSCVMGWDMVKWLPH
jgi:hypothetical protein